MAKRRAAVASTCLWRDGVSQALIGELLKSLDPLRSVTLITSDPCDVDRIRGGRRLRTTLGELVRSGHGTAVSLPKNDTHDAFLIRGGVLYMLLTAESFASFGLDGKKYGTRYFTAYELHKPGKRLERLEWALNSKILAPYDFVVFDAAAVPTPLRAVETRVSVPPLSPAAFSGRANEGANEDEFHEWSNAVLEWIGLVVLSPHLLTENNGGVDAAICDYAHPHHSHTAKVFVCTTRDGVLSEDVERMWKEASAKPWAVLHVQGYEMAPVAFKETRPHELGKRIGYTIVNHQADGCAVFKFLA